MPNNLSIAPTLRGKSSEHFPDPFCDVASLAMPDTIQDAMRWCEYILLKQNSYREAIGRVISYFITDIEISSVGGDDRVGREEKTKYLDFLNDTLGIKAILNAVALDYLCYGNSFTSMVVPFRRYLSCPQCGLEVPLKKVYNNNAFKFSWSGFTFNAHCPSCKYTGKWKHIDRRSGETDQMTIKRWSPHEMDILWDPHTDDVAHIWKIPDEYRNMIRRGHLHQLERASWEIVQAVQNNQALLFDPDVIYHMKEESLAGVHNRGWGISKVLTNFGQAWYVQVLKRYNEAIALDYVIPFRVITPQPRPGTGGDATQDPVLTINLGGFASRVENMIKARRQDPARWNILPFPIEYKALGGDATQLAPTELLNQGLDELLNSVGVPAEMYRGSLSVQAAPAALRLFEANWSHLVHNMNRFLSSMVDKISQLMSWEPVRAKLVRVTHADDLNRQMAKLQLMMGGQISRTTGLGTVGLEFEEEERRKLEEERISAEAAADMQAEMESSALMDEMAMPAPPPGGDPAAMGGGATPQGQMPMMQGMPGAMPGGGAPPVPGDPSGGGGGGAPPAGAPPGAMGVPQGPGGAAASFNMQQIPGPEASLEELQSMASQWAAMLLSMPESQKDSTMIRLKRENETLSLLVKSIMAEEKRNAELQGRDMILQQQYGKQARAIDL